MYTSSNQQDAGCPTTYVYVLKTYVVGLLEIKMAISTAANELNIKGRIDRSKGRTARLRMASARVSDAELGELEAAASLDGKLLAEWARDVLLREARTPRIDAVFTEIVAIRMLLNLVLKAIACGEAMTPQSFNEVLTKVRVTKLKSATDVMQQYATVDQKEN
jgi:hypothetical protein